MKDLNISDTSFCQWGRSLRNHHGAATQVHEAENPWWGWSDLCKPAALDGTNNGSADDVGMDLGKIVKLHRRPNATVCRISMWWKALARRSTSYLESVFHGVFLRAIIKMSHIEYMVVFIVPDHWQILCFVFVNGKLYPKMQKTYLQTTGHQGNYHPMRLGALAAVITL